MQLCVVVVLQIMHYAIAPTSGKLVHNIDWCLFFHRLTLSSTAQVICDLAFLNAYS